MSELEGRRIGQLRRVRMLESRNAMRREVWAAQQVAMEKLLEEKDREIANLKAQLTMGVAK